MLFSLIKLLNVRTHRNHNLNSSLVASATIQTFLLFSCIRDNSYMFFLLRRCGPCLEIQLSITYPYCAFNCRCQTIQKYVWIRTPYILFESNGLVHITRTAINTSDIESNPSEILPIATSSGFADDKDSGSIGSSMIDVIIHAQNLWPCQQQWNGNRRGGWNCAC